MLRDELKSSVAKNEILKIIDKIDSKHTGFTGIFKIKSPVTEKVYPEFITKNLDLPDLLFLQYLILELKKPQYEKNVYRVAISNEAIKIKKELLKPHINQTEFVCFALGVGSALLGQHWLLLMACLVLIFSEQFTESRLNKQLDTQLAIKFNNGQIAKLDNYDSKIDSIEKIGHGAIQTIEKSFEYVTSLYKR